MKNMTRSLPFKTLIFILTAILLLTAAVSCVATVCLEATQFYNYTEEDLKANAMGTEIYEDSHSAFRGFYYSYSVPTDPNFRYTVMDAERNPITGTGTENAEYIHTYYYYEWVESGYDYYSGYYQYYDSEFSESELSSETSNGAELVYIVMGGYAKAPVANGNLYWIDRGISLLYRCRLVFPVTAVLSLILTALCAVTLCSLAGRKAGVEEPVLVGANRIPFDLFLALLVATGVGLVLLTWLVVEWEILSLCMVTLPILGLAFTALVTWLIASFAARIKYGGILKKTLIGRFYAGSSVLIDLIRKIPTVPTVACIAGFVGFCNIVLGGLSQDGAVAFLLTAESLIGFGVSVAVAAGFASVEKHGKAIADGDLDHKMDTKFLVGPLKNHAENLNRIGDGLNAAVSERIKSERMKTELITNVSHDIKTPLTSIINYVDLLSKEPEMNADTAEYLLILQRQSARLKKLTEDIVEASKASSGAITIDPAPCDLGVLLEQTAGEYEEKTKACNLTVLLSKPENPVTVLADGKRLWRVFDNLMNNICKYALPGTRVYLALSTTDEKAVITFRNISKDPLNIDPSELTERFVRGDQSRHSEGSGLGLAIVRSLTELQNGTFDITIDADLFKVTVTFPLLEADKE